MHRVIEQDRDRSVKRRLAAQDFIQRGSQRVLVHGGPGLATLPRRLFRRHIRWGAQDGAITRHPGVALGLGGRDVRRTRGLFERHTCCFHALAF